MIGSLPSRHLFKNGLLQSLRSFAMTVVFLFAPISFADDIVDPGLAAARQQLAIEQERNAVAKDRLQALQREKQGQIQVLQPDQISSEDLRRGELEVNLLHADLSAVILSLTDVEQTIRISTQTIRDIRQQLQDAAFVPTGTAGLSPQEIGNLTQRLEIQRQLLKVQQSRYAALKEAQSLIKSRLDIQTAWNDKLERAYQNNEHSKRQRALDQLERSMQQEQQKWIGQLAELNKQMRELIDKGATQTPEYAKLALHIFEAEERVNVSQLQSNLMRLRLQITDDISVEIAQAQSINDWNTISNQIDPILFRLGTMRGLLEGKIALIEQRQAIEAAGAANLAVLNDLAMRYEKQLKTVDALFKQMYSYQAQVTKSLRTAIARRQGLPGFSLQEWVGLGKKLSTLPVLAWDFANTVQKQLMASIEAMSDWTKGLFVVLELLLLATCLFLSRTLSRLRERFHKKNYWTATSILEAILTLILRNLTGIFVFSTFVLMFWMTDMPAKVYTFIVSIGLIWFGMQFVLDGSKMILFDSHKASAERDIQHDLKLFQIIRWVSIAGGMVMLLLVLSYQLPVDYEVRDFFSRIAMLFLLGIAFALLKGRKLILSVLYPYLAHNHHYLKRHYLKRVFFILSLLLPFMLISNALVGLAGYLQLSWTIAIYQAYFLLILTGYLVARGLLRDVTEWSSGWIIRRLRNGWLWSEAILKPLDRIFHVGLVLLSGFAMMTLSESGRGSFVVDKVSEWMQIRLGEIAGSELTLVVLFKLFIAIVILFWVARWSREFSYRWLFVRIKDVGLRNSLAIFIQYTAVIIGIFICLRILGLNWVAFAAILTGLAVGIGFGLRDLANNFVSGILLLIERPVRKGDLVTIAGHEGEVTHIGMRSLTVYTGDHTEVIVPHSEAFSKTFTNWTLQDSIVRGTIIINISRQDDPHAIQIALLQVLKQTTGVVTNPPPEVLLKDIDDTVIEFQVHYFINLQVTPFRSVMRSTILFAIWDCLSAMGIQPPHPQQDVHIKTMPVIPAQAGIQEK